MCQIPDSVPYFVFTADAVLLPQCAVVERNEKVAFYGHAGNGKYQRMEVLHSCTISETQSWNTCRELK